MAFPFIGRCQLLGVASYHACEAVAFDLYSFSYQNPGFPLWGLNFDYWWLMLDAWCLMLDACLMVHGSRLMAHGQGSWLMAKGARPGPGDPGARAPGPGPGPARPWVPRARLGTLGHEPWALAMSHEPWALSLEPGAMNQQACIKHQSSIIQ